MLLHVSLLGESLGAVGVRAPERPFLRMRAHVIHELRRVGDDAVTIIVELALKQTEVGRVFH